VVGPPRLSAALFVAALCLAIIPERGQEPSTAKPDILLSFSADAGLGDPVPYLRSLEAAILSEPSVGGLAQYDAAKDGAPADAALREGCPAFLDVRLSTLPDGRVAAAWVYLDAVSGKKTPGPGFEKPLPSRAVLASSFWTEFLVDLETRLAEPPPSIILEVLAPPGTLFDGTGPKRVVPATGRLDIRFSVPASVAWTARVPGRYPTRGFLMMEAGTTVLRIAPHDFSLAVGAVGLSFPEAFVDMAVADHISLRAGFAQYFYGLALRDTSTFSSSSTPSNPGIVASFPLLSPFMGLSWSPFARNRDFRPYASAALFARVAFLSASKPYFDPVAPLGFDLSVGFDWGLGRGIRLWAEAGANLYPWADFRAFLASAGTNGDGRAIFGEGSIFAGNPGWAGELPIAAAGIRIGL